MRAVIEAVEAAQTTPDGHVLDVFDRARMEALSDLFRGMASAGEMSGMDQAQSHFRDGSIRANGMTRREVEAVIYGAGTCFQALEAAELLTPAQNETGAKLMVAMWRALQEVFPDES